MTNQNFPRRLLDDAIDRTVRDLMDADARPGLRRRVLDRITQPQARAAWWPTVLIPAGALAAIVLAVIFLRPAPEATVADSRPTPPPPPVVAVSRPPVTVTEAPPVKPPVTRNVPRRDEPRQFTFGPPTGRVSATNVQNPGSAQKPQTQPANIRVDLTITEQRDGVTDPPKTLTVLVADRDQAQVQSSGTGGLSINVSARPEVVGDGQIRVNLRVNYRGSRSDANPVPVTLSQGFSSMVESGKPVVVTQWNESGSTRSVKVELKATIQR